MAGVALGDIQRQFAWQARHLRHWAGSGGAPGSQLTPWAPRLFAWQAWRLVTSTFALLGRRGTYGTGRALVAHQVLSSWLFALQAWHLVTSALTLRGRRVFRGHPTSLCVAGVALTALGGLWWRTGFSADAVGAAALCVAGVALGDIDFRFAWQAWRLVTSTFALPGRRGTYGTVAHRVLS